jgi:iron(III) transport system substrate-binding protein
MRTRTVRWAAVPLAALGLAASVAACGSSSTSNGASSANNNYNTMSAADLASAANTEGQVNWYTTFASTDVQPIVAEFNKAYPKIKVNPLRLSASQLPPKIITEQRGHQYTADVVSGDSPQLAQLIQANALQPYSSPDQTPLPQGLSLPSGYQSVVYAVTTVLAWNPTIVKQKGLPVPTSIETFTQPAWKGKFSIDPTAVNWYDALIKIMGHQQALALVQKLGNNSPVLVESHTQALTDVQAGEPAGAVTAYGYKASSLEKKTPTEVDFLNPNPLPSSLNLIDLVANAPHPAAARLFVNWMVSQAGQAAVVAQTNHTSLRSDVTNDSKVWDPTKWNPTWGNPTLPSATYNSELTELGQALHAPAQ